MVLYVSCLSDSRSFTIESEHIRSCHLKNILVNFRKFFGVLNKNVMQKVRAVAPQGAALKD